MNKLLSLLALVTVISFSAQAQDEGGGAYGQGTSIIHLSTGFAPTGKISGFGYTTKSSLPLSLSYEYGVTDRISVGLLGGFYTNKAMYEGEEDFKQTHIIIGARGSYHFATSEKFDPYFGLMIGYNKISYKWADGSTDETGLKASGVLPGAYLGANYYFSNNIGLHAEVGYGVSIITAGITFKL